MKNEVKGIGMEKKILIVDDEDAIRELIRLTLEDEGYELYEAFDGQQALLKAQEIKPDLIILDVMMPRVVGYMVCREIKENPETQNSAVLFVSSRSSRTALNTMEMEGGDDYIIKPFEPSELRAKVKKLLGLD